MAELNGACGKLVSFAEDRGRWVVQLDSGGNPKNVLPTNVVPEAPKVLPKPQKRAAEEVTEGEAPAKRRQSSKQEGSGAASAPVGKASASSLAKSSGSASQSSRGAKASNKVAQAKAATQAPKAKVAPGLAVKDSSAQAKAKLDKQDQKPSSKAASAGVAPPKAGSSKASAKPVVAGDSSAASSRAKPPAKSSKPSRAGRAKPPAEGQAPLAVILRQLLGDGGEVKPDAAALKSAKAELDALAGGSLAEGEELQGEGGGRRPAQPAKPAQPAQPAALRKASTMSGDPDADVDDALLMGLGDELEGESEVSDDPDAGELDDEDDEDDLADALWEPVGELPVPDVWSRGRRQHAPGDEGFNAWAAERVAGAGLGTAQSPFAGLGMRLHQESAAFLVHPTSPIRRLLVDHATGTGKTLIMLRILENFFDDPRPKVAIFPKDSVCDSFYRELLKWPTRWRHYFAHARPDDAALASGAHNWRRKASDVWDLNNERLRLEARRRNVRQDKVIRELVDSIRGLLEMKNAIRRGKVRHKAGLRFQEQHPGAPVPRAPLRAFRYTTAGGGAAEFGTDGWPRSPLLKVGFDPKELNPYSAKVVIMDECHNLVRPTAKYEEQLGRLRTMLRGARQTCLVGFTGTPIGNDAPEGRRLLDVIKGEAAVHLGDEGFVSSFHARGSADFPREEPVSGIPDGVLHEGMFERLLKRHSLHGEALKRYLLKEQEFQIIPRLLRLPQERRNARLANYCNLHVHYGAYHGANRTALLNDPKDFAPKFHAVAKSVAKSKEKAVVMLSREMGFKTMLELLKKVGKKCGFKVATMSELGDFNDAKRNLRGERFRVLAAESSQAGEGVQFRHVRRVYLVDVPLRHSDLVQRCSRCVRLGGHQELPPEERVLAIELHLAVLPKLLRGGPGSLIYRELLNAKEIQSTSGRALENAVEACLKELKRRGVKTIPELQTELQKEDGEKFIELLTETALEQLGDTGNAPARPLAIALWRLRRGGDDLENLECALVSHVQTADEKLLETLADKSAELLPPLEAMRLGAVDRQLLKSLGDPPRAPAVRTMESHMRMEKARVQLQADVTEPEPVTAEDEEAPDDGEDDAAALGGADSADEMEVDGLDDEELAAILGEDDEGEDDDVGIDDVGDDE